MRLYQPGQEPKFGKNISLQAMKGIAEFHRIVLNYLRMQRLLNEPND